MKVLSLFVIFIVFNFCYADEDTSFEDNVYKEAVGFVVECASKDISLCFKERALKYMEQIPSNVDIGGGIKIKGLDNERTGKQYTPLVLPEEPRARETAVDNALIEKFSDYLSSHTMEFKFPTDSVKDLQRSMDEGRRRKGGGGGKKGGGMNMMMMLSMKAALLGALALKAIALIAFKALIVAKIAFTISAIIALKKLLGGKQHTSTYEVVAHPHYEEHGGGGHYDRSFAAETAYRGHLDANKIANSHY